MATWNEILKEIEFFNQSKYNYLLFWFFRAKNTAELVKY